MRKIMSRMKLTGGIILGVGALTLMLVSCGNPALSLTSSTTSSSSSTQVSTTSANTQANPDENMSVSFDNQQVNPGDTFTVNIMINTLAASRGGQCSISFDSSAMQCTGVTEGTFFKTWAAANGVSTTMMPAAPAADNTSGTLNITAIAVMGQTQAELNGQGGQGAQGSGSFLILQMTAKTGINKQASVKLSNVQIYDANAQLVNNVSESDGIVTIGTP